MVLGISGVYGHQRQVAPVLAAAGRNRRECLSLCQHIGREDVRDLMRMDGDHGDRLLAGQRAEHLEHLGPRQAVTRGARWLNLDKVAIPGTVPERLVNDQFRLASLHRLDSEGAVLQHPKDPEDRFRALLENLYHPRGVGWASRLVRGEGFRQDPVADARGSTVAARLPDCHDWRNRTLIVGRPGKQATFRVATVYFQYRHMGQGSWTNVPLALLFQQALILQVAQEVLQPDAVIATQRERLGDLALS